MSPFPPNPDVGDIVVLENGAAYIWDGEKWAANTAPQVHPYMPLSGGTMSGPLSLAGNATSALQAVPLQQMTAAIGTPVTSFNARTGAVVLSLGDVTGVGGAPLDTPAFSGNPTSVTPAPGNATTRIATTAFVAQAVSGIAAGVTSFNTRTGAVTLSSADVTAALTFTPYNATNPSGYQTAAQVTAALGGYVAKTGDTMSGPLTISGANMSAGGIIRSTTGRIVAQSSAANPSVAVFDSTQGWSAGMFLGDSSQLYFGAMDGNGVYASPNWYGRFSTLGNFEARGYVLSNGFVYAAGATSFGLGAGGAGRMLQFSSGWYWDWDTTSGNHRWITPNGAMWNMRNSDNLSWNQVGPVGGNGAYANISDIRTKRDITPSGYGLAEVLRLEPIAFTRIPQGRVEYPREIGFSAQQVREIIPQAVRAMDNIDTDEPTLGMSDTPIIAALVNAVKQLAAEVAELRERTA